MQAKKRMYEQASAAASKFEASLPKAFEVQRDEQRLESAIAEKRCVGAKAGLTYCVVVVPVRSFAAAFAC